MSALAARGAAVLQAPPGAGKTTRVPLALLAAGSVSGKIVVLEPRRVAARAAAERLAESLDETPGGQVGYRMRGASVSGGAIEVVTEGVLTRMLQDDPSLEGVGAVIFDEFHERALQADLGLALLMEARAALRPDLHLVVMSATLDAGPVAALLGDVPVITAAGRSFPVETIWLDRPWRGGGAGRGPRLEAALAPVVRDALERGEGGALVFLPGRSEIARLSAALAGSLPPGVSLMELHGGLPLAAQRAVLRPAGAGRKLVLATALAETALTIPDVRVVVDAGLARRPVFDPGSGMSRLVTRPVSRAEAEQRRGRAGRVAPGTCYRFWTRAEEGALSAAPPPEISAVDLAGLALELALWGGSDPGAMAFLTPPREAPLAEARGLLARLGALGPDGRITDHGRALARLPLHPRLAHMLVRAGARGQVRAAAELAALCEARDVLRAEAGGRAPADLALRRAALRDTDALEADAPVRVNRPALSAVRSEAARLERLAPVVIREREGGVELSAGGLLSLAYPDRIARRRNGDAPRYLLSGGAGAALEPSDRLASEPWLVVADLDGDRREAAIRRALPVAEGDLRALHGGELVTERACRWSRRHRVVEARERRMLGALALEDRPWRDAPAELRAAAAIEGVRDLGIDALPWDGPARRLVARIAWARARGADLPDFSEAGLMADLADWLGPHLGRVSAAADYRRLPLMRALEDRLGWEGREMLDRFAPADLRAPTGTWLAIDYADTAPSVSVRVQEMFGMGEHPVVGPDKAPVLVHLLSPAGRPVQSTRDLPGFWTTSYADVRRDLRGRYPRHPWPEDPASAAPTRRAKPRGG